MLVHEQARSYNKIKSKDIVESLYEDFIPYNELKDFSLELLIFVNTAKEMGVIKKFFDCVIFSICFSKNSLAFTILCFL